MSIFISGPTFRNPKVDDRANPPIPAPLTSIKPFCGLKGQVGTYITATRNAWALVSITINPSAGSSEDSEGKWTVDKRIYKWLMLYNSLPAQSVRTIRMSR